MGNNTLDVCHFRGLETNLLLNCSGKADLIKQLNFESKQTNKIISKGPLVYSTMYVINSED